jgi:hypothetical protein
MTVNQKDSRSLPKPEISRYAFAMFDVLGFSRWVKTAGLQAVLDSYHRLIERVVIKSGEKGGLSAVQTPEGSIFAVIGPPGFAYFSDTILLWCPLAPPFAADFVERCGDLICEGLAMGVPLRGALTLGDAVLDEESRFFIGEPIIEAANLEKGQNWVGLTLGNSAIWSAFLAQLHGTSIIEYPPPMKESLKEYASPIVIDWPRRWRNRHGSCPSEKLRTLNTDPRFTTYWDNSIAFAQYSLRKHDWHLRPDEIPADALLRIVSRAEAKF